MSTSEKTVQRIPDDKLTRIPVRSIQFAEIESFNGVSSSSNYSSITKLDCGPPKQENVRRYVLCSFIPAWQMFEITFHDPESVQVRMMPAARVRFWDRAEEQR